MPLGGSSCACMLSCLVLAGLVLFYFISIIFFTLCKEEKAGWAFPSLTLSPSSLSHSLTSCHCLELYSPSLFFLLLPPFYKYIYFSHSLFSPFSLPLFFSLLAFLLFPPLLLLHVINNNNNNNRNTSTCCFTTLQFRYIHRISHIRTFSFCPV